MFKLENTDDAKSADHSLKRMCLQYFILIIFFNQANAQIISNKSVAVSVASGTVVGVDSVNNDATSTLTNDGTINLFTINNSGNVQGNGTLNIAKNFSNTGTFLPGTSTVNYKGSIDQTIIPVNYYNLTVTENGTRTITLDSLSTIGIANVFTVAGGSTSYILTGTTLDFNGTTLQTVPAFPFHNLTIDNISGATLDGTSSVEGILNPLSGDFNTNDYLTLLSTASRTALIDGSGNGEVLDNVTMQRYLASGFGYKYWSSPFQSSTVNELSDEVNLGASFPTLYQYDESLVSSGWVNYTNIIWTLDPMYGYAANFGSSMAALTVDMTGIVSNHTISATLYNHNQPYTQGFNLMGNPYPSPIDWDAGSGWTRTNIDDAVYYFNASDTNQYTGIYTSYINGISSDGIANNLIAAMQGFFVHVSDGTYPVAGTLAMDNAVRVNNPSPVFHKPEGDSPPLLRLTARFTNSMGTSDAMVIYFDDAASNEFEKENDALKLMNTDANTPSIYSFSENAEKLSINGMSEPKDSTTIIPLGLQSEKNGDLIIQAADIDEMPRELHIYLADAETGKIESLNSGSQYVFHVSEGKFENRFSLLFSKRTDVATSGAQLKLNAYAYGKNLFVNATGTVTDLVIYNSLGQIMLRTQLHDAGYHEINTQLFSGIYVVNLLSNDSRYSKNIFIGDE